MPLVQKLDKTYKKNLVLKNQLRFLLFMFKNLHPSRTIVEVTPLYNDIDKLFRKITPNWDKVAKQTVTKISGGPFQNMIGADEETWLEKAYEGAKGFGEGIYNEVADLFKAAWNFSKDILKIPSALFTPTGVKGPGILSEIKDILIIGGVIVGGWIVYDQFFRGKK
jgi:hypothetical protein